MYEMILLICSNALNNSVYGHNRVGLQHKYNLFILEKDESLPGKLHFYKVNLNFSVHLVKRDSETFSVNTFREPHSTGNNHIDFGSIRQLE